MKILLVEDTIGEPVQAVLRKWGHEVVLVTSGTAAREQLQRGDFELFLLDWILPDGSGLDLVRTVRSDARFRDAPVLMMSSRTDRADIITAVRSGIDGYVAKPFRPDELRGRIEEAWQRRSQERSEREKIEHIVSGQTPLDRHGEGPLIVLGEEATTTESLEAPANAHVLEYLTTVTATIAAANAFLPTLNLGYCLASSTGDISKLLRQRATCDRVQLAVVSIACQGNPVVMARLLHLRDARTSHLCVVTSGWSELDESQRGELESLGVPVLARRELDASRWRDIIELQVIQSWSPELHAQYVDTGLRDPEVWEDLLPPPG